MIAPEGVRCIIFNVGNAYFNGRTREKVYAILEGVEHGPKLEGRAAIVVKSFYGFEAVYDKIKRTYTMKGVGVPEYYLRAECGRTEGPYTTHGSTTTLPAKTYIVTLSIYFDASFACDMITRRSVTGIIVFVNRTPIRWYVKKQNTVETSTYGVYWSIIQQFLRCQICDTNH